MEELSTLRVTLFKIKEASSTNFNKFFEFIISLLVGRAERAERLVRVERAERARRAERAESAEVLDEHLKSSKKQSDSSKID